jgi:hypothetical protein
MGKMEAAEAERKDPPVFVALCLRVRILNFQPAKIINLPPG